MGRRLFLLILLGVLLVGCNSVTHIADVARTIHGTVTDSITGLAIGAASIWVGDSAHPDPERVMSDSVGDYLWQGIGVMPDLVICSKAGYHSQGVCGILCKQPVHVD